MQKTTILLLLFLVSNIAFAQVDAYEDATITAGLPVKLSAVYEGYFGTLVTVHDDDFAGPFDIGFDFTFYGETASQFMIDPVFAEKRGIEQNQPLIAVPANESKPVLKQLFSLTNNNVIVALLKPVDDGKGILVRLYNPGNEVETVSFNFGTKKPKLYLTGPNGEDGEKTKNEFKIPPLGIRTVVIRGSIFVMRPVQPLLSHQAR